MPLVFGPPGVWLQTLLLKHNRRVKQRQQNLIAADMLKPRPRASGLGLETAAPPMLLLSQQLNGEGHCSTGHYRTSSQLPEPGTDEPSNQLLRYITYINSDTFDHSSSELAKLYCDFSVL